jgi:serine/threonine protein kinase
MSHDGDSAPTEALPDGLLSPGQMLGGRYQVRDMLGRGGMGEVWRAFDLKLRVEVALKALREDLFRDETRRDLLRREVRSAREVISPNVCRIFDLIEVDGRELVSMEYVDGATLLELLEDHGPLELRQAQDIASQFLGGLEAIHRAGLVHRDVKPENIMITPAGRVVVMDFGLARQGDSGAGTDGPDHRVLERSDSHLSRRLAAEPGPSVELGRDEGGRRVSRCRGRVHHSGHGHGRRADRVVVGPGRQVARLGQAAGG